MLKFLKKTYVLGTGVETSQMMIVTDNRLTIKNLPNRRSNLKINQMSLYDAQ